MPDSPNFMSCIVPVSTPNGKRLGWTVTDDQQTAHGIATSFRTRQEAEVYVIRAQPNNEELLEQGLAELRRRYRLAAEPYLQELASIKRRRDELAQAQRGHDASSP